MRQIIYFLTILLLFTGCAERSDYGNSGGDGGTERALVGRDLVVHSIFPRTPMIAKGGSVTLTAAVTDQAGYLLTSKLDDPIYIEWSSSNPSVATVDERGNIYGKDYGTATITAVAKRGNIRSIARTITVTVIGENSVDTAEIFFSPPQAFLDLNGKRTFRLSAVDHSGAATALSEGSMTFELSNDNIVISPETIHLTGGNKAVEIEATGISKGFVFVTPIYTKGLVRITGTPLAIQVKDPVETNAPTTTVDAGQYLSIAISEDGTGFKGAKVMHFDATENKLLFSDFYGSWAHTLSAAVSGAGKSAKMTLSPFADNYDKPIAILMQNKKSYIWYQTRSELWDSVSLSSAEIVDENNTYSDNDRLMDVVAYKSDGNTTQSVVHVAYYDAAGKQVCLASLNSPSSVTTGTHACLAVAGAVNSVSVAVNHTTGEPRMAYGVNEYTKEDNTTTPATIFYASRQGGSLYKETVAIQNEKISAKAKHIVLKLDRSNKPIIALSDGRDIKLFYREAVGTKFSWQILPVTAVDPFPTSIASLDFALDSYNEPRLVYATVGDDGQKVRYAKRVPFINRSYRWTIETPALSTEGNQGRSVAIAVDSQNRAHLVYTIDSKKWFNYWAEPNFFNYQNFPVATYTGADLIKP